MTYSWQGCFNLFHRVCLHPPHPRRLKPFPPVRRQYGWMARLQEAQIWSHPLYYLWCRQTQDTSTPWVALRLRRRHGLHGEHADNNGLTGYKQLVHSRPSTRLTPWINWAYADPSGIKPTMHNTRWQNIHEPLHVSNDTRMLTRHQAYTQHYIQNNKLEY